MIAKELLCRNLWYGISTKKCKRVSLFANELILSVFQRTVSTHDQPEKPVQITSNRKCFYHPISRTHLTTRVMTDLRKWVQFCAYFHSFVSLSSCRIRNEICLNISDVGRSCRQRQRIRFRFCFAMALSHTHNQSQTSCLDFIVKIKDDFLSFPIEIYCVRFPLVHRIGALQVVCVETNTSFRNSYILLQHPRGTGSFSLAYVL